MAAATAILSHIYTITTLFLTLLLLEILISFRTLFKYLSLHSSSTPHNNLIQLVEDKVPSTLFTIKTLHADQSVPECSVCLSKFEEGDKIRKLKCKHTFHKDCLDRWLEQEFGSATCPLCRREVLPRDVALRLRVGLVEGSQYDGSDEELIFLLSALQDSNLHTLF